MAADNWKMYNKAKEYAGDGTTDYDTHTFKCALFASTYTPALTDSSYTTISGDEIASGNGYTTGGVTLTTVTWTESSGTVTFVSDDPTWTASGGSIVCRYAVVYNDTDAGKALVCYSLLDNTPADVTTPDTEPLILQLSANGYCQVSGT